MNLIELITKYRDSAIDDSLELKNRGLSRHTYDVGYQDGIAAITQRILDLMKDAIAKMKNKKEITHEDQGKLSHRYDGVEFSNKRENY